MNQNVLKQPFSRFTQLALAATAAFALLLVLSFTALAQDGDLDPDFGTNGTVTTNVLDNDRGNAAAIQPDGKLLVAGSNGTSFAVVRYNPDGALDRSFSDDGIVTTTFDDSSEAGGIVVDSEGRIIAAGRAGDDFAVARYLPDGELDPAFGNDGLMTTDFNRPGSSYTSAVGTNVTLDGGGNIVVVGYVRNGSEYNDFAIVRYTPDGDLDTTFNSGGTLPPGRAGIITTSVNFDQEDQAYAVAVQPDGKIIVVGDTDGAPGRFVMLRYNSDGALDTDFGDEGQVYAATNKVATGEDVALQADGKIVVTAAISVIDQTTLNCINSNGRYCEYADMWAGRFNADGTPDAEFGTEGEVVTPVSERGNDDAARGIAIQSDGKIVIVGFTDMSIHTFNGEDEFFTRTNDFTLVRYSSDGTLDTAFGSEGKRTTDFPGTTSPSDEGRAVALQADGKIIVAGVSDRDFAVARYMASATTDTSTTTTLTPTPNPSSFGQEVTFTAVISAATGAAPTSGAVFFSTEDDTLGTVTLASDNTATLAISTLAVGPHTITATYDGSDGYTGSFATITQTVTETNTNKTDTTTTLTSTPNPSAVDESVTLTAQVSGSGGTPTGSVTFSEGTATLGTGTLNNGTATLTTTSLAAGPHTITATYSGDTAFNPSTATHTHTVTTGSTDATQVSTARAVASSALGDWPQDRLNDGAPGPAWSSLGNNGHLEESEWAVVILNERTPVDSVRLRPRGNSNSPGNTLGFPKDFVLQYSYNGAVGNRDYTCDPNNPFFSDIRNWQPLLSLNGYPQPPSEWLTFDFNSQRVQCVRLLGVELSQDDFGARYMQIGEFELYNGDAQVQAARAVASSALGDWPQERLIDGAPGPAWSSLGNNGHLEESEWAVVILNDRTPVDSVRLRPRGNSNSPGNTLGFPKDFVLQYSYNGAFGDRTLTCNPDDPFFNDIRNWQPLLSLNGYPQPPSEWLTFDFNSQRVQCVRLLGVELSQDDFGARYMQIGEFELYNGDAQVQAARAVASSALGDWPQDRLIDGAPGPAWSSLGNNGHLEESEWAVVILDGRTAVDSARLRPRGNSNSPGNTLGFPKDFVLQYSYNGAVGNRNYTCDPNDPFFSDIRNWQPLLSFNGYPQPANEWLTFDFNSQRVQCVRLLGVELSQDDFGARYMQIGEFELYTRQ